MDEKIREILDKYDLSTASVCRGRGAYICTTDRGLCILREYFPDPDRLVFESLVKYTIRDRGYMNVDQIIVSREGALFTKNRYDKNFVLREWFDGRECDMRSPSDLTALTVNLARLHRAMSKVPLSPEMAQKYTHTDTRTVLEKHCREMRSIRNYMKNCRRKKEFENLYLEYYDLFSGQAQAAVQALDAKDYQDLAERARQEHTLCHGDYNHHNVILMRGRGGEGSLPAMATVNFDRMHPDIQINDLYLFLRKAMEKNSWDVNLGMSIVQAYDQERPMSREEKKYLYILMLFPEKFWKIANHYYNTRKSWACARNLEKLEAFIHIRALRERFLECFRKKMI